jgi:hypothetical protein
MAAALIACMHVATVATAGGWAPYPQAETGPASHVAALAGFALRALRAQSNSLDLQAVSFERVVSAEHQVVAGTNYRVVCALAPHGTATLALFEQPWTRTLLLNGAVLAPGGASNALIDLLGGSPLGLDADAFDAYAAALAPPPAHGCDGGRRWNECASACERTCAEPAPMCTVQCVARCECPPEAPLVQGGACVASEACAAEPRANLGADGHGQWQGAGAVELDAEAAGAPHQSRDRPAVDGEQVLGFLAVACVVLGAYWALRSKLPTSEARRRLVAGSGSSTATSELSAIGAK